MTVPAAAPIPENMRGCIYSYLFVHIHTDLRLASVYFLRIKEKYFLMPIVVVRLAIKLVRNIIC